MVTSAGPGVTGTGLTGSGDESAARSVRGSGTGSATGEETITGSRTGGDIGKIACTKGGDSLRKGFVWCLLWAATY